MAIEYNILEKRLYENKPTGETANPYKSNGQYSYGRVTATHASNILGINNDNLNTDMDLYSVVYTKIDKNIDTHPKGYIYGRSTEDAPSYFKFHHVHSGHNAGSDTDDDVIKEAHFGFYLYDGWEALNQTRESVNEDDELYSGFTTGARYVCGATSWLKKGYDIAWGIAGDNTGTSIKHLIYQNDRAKGGIWGQAHDDEDSQDGPAWNGKTPGHLLASNFDRDSDQEHSMADNYYYRAAELTNACENWSEFAQQGLEGWKLWKNDRYNHPIPLEYCVYFYEYGTSYIDGDKAPNSFFYDDYNLNRAHFQMEQINDSTKFEKFLKGEADDGESYNYDSSTNYNVGIRASCRFHDFDDDNDCNQLNTFGVLDGECPDEDIPFYCGVGLASGDSPIHWHADDNRSYPYDNNTYETSLWQSPDHGYKGVNKVYDFQLGWHETDRPYNPPFHQGGPTGNSRYVFGEHFSDYLMGKGNYYDTKNLIVAIAVSGGEELEKKGSGTRYDERDRQFARMNIPKSFLYEIWKNQKGETKTFNFWYGEQQGLREKSHNSYEEKLIWENGWDSSVIYDGHPVAHNLTDVQGEDDGYSSKSNATSPILRFQHIRLKVKAPTFNPLLSIESFENGGLNANWVDKTKSGWWCVNGIDTISQQRVGLSPLYDIDFIGWGSTNYGGTNSNGENTDGNKYYFLNTIVKDRDFRPISFVESTLEEVDLQGYYETENLEENLARLYTSAPNNVNLYFRLAKSNNAASPEYIDDYSGDYKYWFMVANWDWKIGDAGGGNCESTGYDGDCLSDLALTFPQSQSDLEYYIEFSDTFKLGSINDDQEEHPIKLTHQYIEPGIKIIKAIVFTTIDISEDYHGTEWCADGIGTQNLKDGSIREGCKNYENLRQAVHWKLVSIKINLNGEGVFPQPDFDDLGGDEYTYLPMPETISLEDQILAPSGIPYKTSHPIISGLSENSKYLKSINDIYKEDKFSLDEANEKNILLKSINLSSFGSMDEMGNYLGTTDISQIRYFNSPFDMHSLLTIENDIVINQYEFHPYNDFNYWNGEPSYWEGYNLIPSEPTFPEESPVGDIFISEYKQFDENCLFEFNFGDSDDKTVKDTAGNGNKGIFIGDYSVKKQDIGNPADRDSYIKIPKLKKDKDNGAF